MIANQSDKCDSSMNHDTNIQSSLLPANNEREAKWETNIELVRWLSPAFVPKGNHACLQFHARHRIVSVGVRPVPPSQESLTLRTEARWPSETKFIASAICFVSRNGEHGTNLFGSEFKSDWPAALALIMIRCLPEFWVMAHLGMSRKGWPLKRPWLKRYMNEPVSASFVDCCNINKSSLPGLSWLLICWLWLSASWKSADKRIVSIGCNKKPPIPSAFIPKRKSLGNSVSHRGMRTTSKPRKPSSRLAVTRRTAASWNLRK